LGEEEASAGPLNRFNGFVFYAPQILESVRAQISQATSLK
jgi:hypothetical protein